MTRLFLAFLIFLTASTGFAQSVAPTSASSPGSSSGTSASGGSSSVGNNSSVEGLFQDPAPDKTAPSNQRINPNLYNGNTMTFFENVNASGYYVTGWDKYYQYPVGTPYNAIDFSFGSDVRVDPTIRAYAQFDIQYPSPIVNPNATSAYNPYLNLLPAQGNLSFSPVIIQQMFLDYTLYNQVFFRLGRQTEVWGQGRIFNPGNFVNDIADGVAVKMTTNLWGLNVTAIGIKNDGFYNVASSDSASASSVAAAAKLESSLGALNWGVSGFYQRSIGYKAEGYLKTSAIGSDLFLEGVVEQAPYQAGLPDDWIPSAVAGLYHEFGDGTTKWLKLEAEYFFSGRGTSESFSVTPTQFYGWNDQSVGLAMTSDALNFMGTSPSFSWLHALKDGSGQVILGVTNTTIPHVALSVVSVYIYGPDNGRYVLENPDTTEYRRLSFTFKATFNLSSQFTHS